MRGCDVHGRCADVYAWREGAGEGYCCAGHNEVRRDEECTFERGGHGDESRCHESHGNETVPTRAKTAAPKPKPQDQRAPEHRLARPAAGERAQALQPERARADARSAR